MTQSLDCKYSLINILVSYITINYRSLHKCVPPESHFFFKNGILIENSPNKSPNTKKKISNSTKS